MGELTGTASDVWRFPNVSGEGRLSFEIVRTTRTGTAMSSRGDDAVRRTFKKLANRQRMREF